MLRLWLRSGRLWRARQPRYARRRRSCHDRQQARLPAVEAAADESSADGTQLERPASPLHVIDRASLGADLPIGVEELRSPPSMPALPSAGDALAPSVRPDRSEVTPRASA